MQQTNTSCYSMTLKLDNQQNGWKGVCVHHEHNMDLLACPVRALGRWYSHIHQQNSDPKTFLLSYLSRRGQWDVTGKNVSNALKVTALVVNYSLWGFPVDSIDTNSLHLGGANALSLASYTDRQYRKWASGKGPHSKSIFAKNCTLSQRACHMT